jgi:hypothetical protein
MLWNRKKTSAECKYCDVIIAHDNLASISSTSNAIMNTSPEATIRKFRLVQTEVIRWAERLVDFYSLDMILAIVKKVLGKGPEEGN